MIGSANHKLLIPKVDLFIMAGFLACI